MGAAMSNYQMDIRPWFREDLKHLIQGLDYVIAQPGAMSEERRSGFLDCLTALALMAGIDLPEIWGEAGAAIIEGRK